VGVGAVRSGRRLAWTALALAGGLVLASCSSAHAKVAQRTTVKPSVSTTTTSVARQTTTTSEPRATTTTTAPAQSVADGPWKVVLSSLDARMASPPLRVHIEVPRVEGTSAGVATVNEIVGRWATAEEHSFVKEVRTLPSSPGSTSSLVASARVTDDTPSVLSLRVDVLESVAGAAHPGERVVTFNFLPSSGRLLALGDLFEPGSDYLATLSRLAEAQLAARFGQGAEVSSFAGPSSGNFGAWYLEPTALVLAFPGAPVALGVPEVRIPLSSLKGLLLPGGPVAG